MVVGVNSQRLWAKLCKALGDPELENDPLFAKKYVRLENRDKLQIRLEAILSRATTDEWITRLTAEGVPCGRMNTIAEALQDPQVQAREVLTEIEGRKFPRAPMRMSKTPVGLTRGSPRIGQHTREVLSNAGLSADQIATLAKAGVLKLDGETP
jgi:formyl-CoA transferase